MKIYQNFWGKAKSVLNGKFMALNTYLKKYGLVVAKGERAGRGMKLEVGVSRCKVLYIEWINNKVLLYSTENYIQYPMINHNGKEYFKKQCVYIYIYKTESLCCTAIINTTL